MALIFDVKVALYEAIRAAVPGGVQVTFAETGDTGRRKQVWLGATTDDDLTPAAMRVGPKPTNVTGYVEVQAVVIVPGSPVNAERAAYELRDYVKDACGAVNSNLAVVPGLQDVRPESSSVETAETTDGAFSALTLRVRVRGRVYQ
ncbi:hypothetical protein F0344_04725 [Streptomyces finlayi]|uniref:Tail terminator n=1 Tax=Streptomyces finlayi TaxID=67296 RepID=A0A7G7BF81_9ACTN|nr:hypothetical protein [Streptomyces finlayi]QNE73996.1 hypothetical protein F0344_04725 [Streptomyces finlayi]